MNYIKWLAISLTLFPFYSYADNSEQDFTDIDFDELMKIEVTSVSKKNEKLSEAAAAIYVVTEEEIRRTGATSIPEALFLVPGVDVAKIDSNKWAISIRGFNGRFANKLLVMIDGRSIYTPTSSGVYWESLNYLMSDIKRIEVIRGPGATLWGTNAVNGVINIITKEATGKEAGSISLSMGSESQGLGASQGAEINDKTKFRTYVNARKLEESKDLSGHDQDNEGKYLQTGIRFDLELDDDQWLTLQGDLYKHDLRQQFSISDFDAPYRAVMQNGDVDLIGGNIGARWGMKTSIDSELNIRTSYDFYEHNDLQFKETRNTLNLEIEHQFTPFKNHELIWGGGYRWSQSDIEGSAYFSTSSSMENIDIWNLFIQDTLDLPEQNMSLTFGAKVEGNTNSSTEVQPNIRLSWLPSNRVTLWGAISRAVRIPSQVESDSTINIQVIPPSNFDPTFTPGLLQIIGNNNFQSEELTAYELGYRWLPTPTLSFDIATFYNVYNNLQSYDIGDAEIKNVNGSTFYVIPINLDNNLEGYSYGTEWLVTWQVNRQSRLRFSYSFIDIKLKDKAENLFSDESISLVADRSLEHQASIWGSFDLSEFVELDLRLYYTSERNWNSSSSDYSISDGVDSDLRIGWQATKSLGFSLIGRHLLHADKQQFITESSSTDSLIERSIAINARYHW
ncbi:TonB-dependent receptor [Psychromonas sp. SP041]|uniref:TonB-dependent receptor plug domain-containing protein n=1 Tax=Psychromonas sp. SP041 TaxID=1365007 RepID=UPI0010C7D1B3|nr:TonB-dependent receptor [Psychromonas sp. SP041]